MITITWIPGYIDIDGNEEADKAAKRAAKPNN
jgi:ribonuclease HI